MPEAESVPEGEAMSELERAAEEALAVSNGDVVAALLRALKRNAALEYELALARGALSRGFSRGWHSRGD
jgi:hypothetical protein